MSSTRKDTDKKSKTAKKDKGRENTDDEDVDMNDPDNNMAPVLEELRNLRKEHAEASTDTKAALLRVETTLKDVVERTDKLEQEIIDAKQRVSDNEDQLQRHERAIRHLLHQEAKLSAKCEEYESRSRRNNVRIYGIKEGEEKNDMIPFITGMIRTSFKLPEDMDLGIERAHRSLMVKPKDSAPPRSIIVRFLDYRVKEKVLQMAWSNRGIMYQGQKIYFDQDYTAEIQQKRKQVREVIKQLKEKKIRAVSPYPAKLKLYLDQGSKTFSTLAEAAPTLREMGIRVKLDEREAIRVQLRRDAWGTASRGAAGDALLTTADLQTFIQGDW